MRKRLEAETIYLATTLALYLAIVYAFAFSQDSTSARQAMNLVILMMDALILWRLWKNTNQKTPAWLAVAVLVPLVLLHADYLLSRRLGGEHGLFGTLTQIKTCLMLGQFAAMLALISPRAPWREFRVDRFDIGIFSIALVPLVNYLARNIGDFSLAGALEYFLLFLALPMVLWVFIRTLQHTLGARISAIPLVIGVTFVHYSMPMVSHALRQPIEALFVVQCSLAIAVSGALAALYWTGKQRLAKSAVAFSTISIAASCLMVLVPGQTASPMPVALNRSDAPLFRHLDSTARRTPDVYFLIYDGYAAPGMMRHYRISNDRHIAYLAAKKFVVYNHAYSIHLSSLSSMSSALDMRAIAEAGIGGATTAMMFFKRNGYRTHFILNSHLLRDAGVVEADVTFPQATYRAGLHALYRGIGGGEFKSEVVFQDTTRDRWLAAKREALSASSGQPRMVYAHSGLPGHSQNSGRCLNDETEQYARRVSTANEEMIVDIETVLQSRRDAIIVIAGDHGPYLTGDCLYLNRYDPDEITAEHLADRYGAMLAIRWPDDSYKEFDQISTIQDTFFAITAYLLHDAWILDYKPMTETIGYGGIPDKAVTDGIVTIGPNQGIPLLR